MDAEFLNEQKETEETKEEKQFCKVFTLRSLAY